MKQSFGKEKRLKNDFEQSFEKDRNLSEFKKNEAKFDKLL